MEQIVFVHDLFLNFDNVRRSGRSAEIANQTYCKSNDFKLGTGRDADAQTIRAPAVYQ
jgi:hypothetical protein